MRVQGPEALIFALAGLMIFAAASAFAAEGEKAGEVTIAARTLACNGVDVSYDPNLPSEGASLGPHLVLNPYLLDEHPQAVRWFVFYHECGHFSGGASELAADRYAMERGLGEGWFDKKVLAQVCQSFGDTPDLPSHPSGRRRCRSLREHFEKVMAFHKSDAPESKIVSAPSTATRAADTAARTWVGTRSAAVPLPVARPPLYDTRARGSAARARPDPIGELIEKLTREGRG
jgi:hypothetical protein